MEKTAAGELHLHTPAPSSRTEASRGGGEGSGEREAVVGLGADTTVTCMPNGHQDTRKGRVAVQHRGARHVVERRRAGASSDRGAMPQFLPQSNLFF